MLQCVFLSSAEHFSITLFYNCAPTPSVADGDTEILLLGSGCIYYGEAESHYYFALRRNSPLDWSSHVPLVHLRSATVVSVHFKSSCLYKMNWAQDFPMELHVSDILFRYFSCVCLFSPSWGSFFVLLWFQMKPNHIAILPLLLLASSFALTELLHTSDEDAAISPAGFHVSILALGTMPKEPTTLSSDIYIRNDDPQMISEKDLIALCWKWQGNPRLLDEFIAEYLPTRRGQEFSDLLREANPRPDWKPNDWMIDDTLYVLQVNSDVRRKFLDRVNANLALRVFVLRRMKSYAIRHQPAQPKEQQQQGQQQRKLLLPEKGIKAEVEDKMSAVYEPKKVESTSTRLLDVSYVKQQPLKQKKQSQKPLKIPIRQHSQQAIRTKREWLGSQLTKASGNPLETRE